MKKIITIFAALALTSVAVSAQSAFGKGDMQVQLSYDVLGGVYTYTNVPANSNLTHIHPITLTAEYGVANFGKITLGVGVQVGYEYLRIGTSTDNIHGTDLSAAARIAGHYSILSNLDAHLGVILGGMFPNGGVTTGGTTTNNSDDAKFAWAPYVGANFYLLGGLGVFADFGFGNVTRTMNVSTLKASDTGVFLNLGLTYKF